MQTYINNTDLSEPPPRRRRWIIAGCAAFGLAIPLCIGGYFWLRDPLRHVDQLIASGNLQGAQLELNGMVRDKTAVPAARMRLAQIRMQAGDARGAENEFKAALAAGAPRGPALLGLGQADLAQRAYAKLLQDVIATQLPAGETAEIALLRAMAEIAMDDTLEAKSSLEEARAALPAGPQVPMIAALVAMAEDNQAEARSQVALALKIDPHRLDALLMQERLLILAGDQPGALAAVDQAVAATPGSVVARLDRASLLIAAGQDGKARADIDQVRRFQPGNPNAVYLNGILLLRAGRDADAAIEFDKLAALSQSLPKTLLYQALIALRLGQPNQGVEFARRYARLVPGDPDGARTLARAQIAAQRPEAALETMKRQAADSPPDAATLDLLGTASIMLGRTTEAAAAFEQAAALAPDNAEVQAHLGLAQLGNGLPLGDAPLDRLLAMAPSQPAAAETLVAAALATGDLDLAQTRLDQLRARVHDTEGVGILSGTIRLARRDLDGARTAFADTVARFPRSVNAALDLARVLALQRRFTESLAVLGGLLAKDPANDRALAATVELLCRRAQFPLAIQAIENARHAAPSNQGFLALLGNTYVRAGDPQRTIALYQLLDKPGGLPPALLAVLAQAQAAAGRPEDSDATYRALVHALPGDLSVRHAQIEQLLRHKQIEPAKAALREGLAATPGNFGMMTLLVSLEAQTGGVDAGLRAAAVLAQGAQNRPDAAYLQGDLLMQEKRYLEAAAAFRAEDAQAPSGPLTLRLANALVWGGRDDDASAALRNWLGRPNPLAVETAGIDVDVAAMLAKLDIKARRIDDAQRNLERVVAQRPTDAGALNNLAWVYLQKNDPRARATAQRAFLQSPAPGIADTLGWIILQQGDPKAAAALLDQAHTQLPDDPAVQFHWAVLLSRTGAAARAVDALRPLIASGADFEGKTEARTLLAELSPR